MTVKSGVVVFNALLQQYPVANTGRAVFLSYASQDAEAARSIRDALEAAGVEVWFDQSDLRGGDTWDRKIRQQIRECALFVPVISAATDARTEGYFRLEWKLAVDRSDLMAEDAHFILPVLLEGTTESAARVPDKFRQVQWTKLRLTESPGEFAMRVRSVLIPQPEAPRAQGTPSPLSGALPSRRTSSLWIKGALATAILATAVIAVVLSQRKPLPGSAANQPSTASAPTNDWPADPGLRRAMQLVDDVDATAVEFALAEDQVKSALARNSGDSDAVTVAAHINVSYLYRSFDRSDQRYQDASRYAEWAVRLQPSNPEALAALGQCLAERGASRVRALELFRKAIRLNPHEPRYLRYLAYYARVYDRPEAVRAIELAKARFPHDVLVQYDAFLVYREAGQMDRAERELDDAIAIQPLSSAVSWKVRYRLFRHHDPLGAKATFERAPESARTLTRLILDQATLELMGGIDTDAVRAVAAMPITWIEDAAYTGPKALLLGELYLAAGKSASARAQFLAANEELIRHRQTLGSDVSALYLPQFWAAYRLGDMNRAHELGTLLTENATIGGTYAFWWYQSFPRLLIMGEKDKALALCHAVNHRPEMMEYLAQGLSLDPRLVAYRNDPELKAALAAPH